jgi:hypothetical protein
MPAAYVEAIVTTPEGSRSRAEAWFEQALFKVIPMRGGLLISGTGQLFESTFGIDLDAAQRGGGDIVLPLPVALRNVVGSVVIRRPPAIHD